MKAKYFNVSYESYDPNLKEWIKKEKLGIYTTYLDMVYRALKFAEIRNLLITQKTIK